MGAPTELPLDVPDADAAEQARALRPDETPPRPPPLRERPEVDEYDAVEQSLVVEDDEDDYR
ncbi:hypothetical protein I6A84_09360 [Frankia sp. CNm7]|uniref:Uncharacterized protein n=1 Tax=Frankia nepalensis TaxID=1836974 RepID=A0A937RFW4_9ACTN|nr:hypothetical protein [Frankia nepalensis]MBL7500828.1 hypothetical protein [Frankia nepalensis]MBL7515384.1 hypothetical protein [Frankia nepalensis]MBL7518312.1 hypothetical protein [Frankia nepalensis]MBL7631446.1 hypothetical protein [Frankia nepalensis]